MLIIGGGDGKQRLNDVYEYDIDNETWTRVIYTGEVNAARAGHIACQFADKMIIFGGGDGVRWLNDIYEFDLVAQKWYLVENNGEIAPGSYGLSAVIYKNRCIMFGGGDGKSWFNSVYEYWCEEESGMKRIKTNMWRIAQQGKFSDCGIAFKHDECESGVLFEYDMLVDCGEDLEEYARMARMEPKLACTPCTPTGGRSQYRWFSTSSVKTLVSTPTRISNM